MLYRWYRECFSGLHVYDRVSPKILFSYRSSCPFSLFNTAFMPASKFHSLCHSTHHLELILALTSMTLKNSRHMALNIHPSIIEYIGIFDAALHILCCGSYTHALYRSQRFIISVTRATSSFGLALARLTPSIHFYLAVALRVTLGVATLAVIDSGQLSSHIVGHMIWCAFPAHNGGPATRNQTEGHRHMSWFVHEVYMFLVEDSKGIY